MADIQFSRDSCNTVELPLEIYSQIIDHMIDNNQLLKPDQPLTEQQSSILKSCALVCRTFWKLVRPRIFRVVVITLDGTRKHISCFVQLLEDFPDIREFILGLELCLVNATQRLSINEDGLLIEEITRYNSILMNLPRVEAVIAQFKPHSYAAMSSPGHCKSDIQHFIEPIIESYCRKGLLRICNIKRICISPSTLSNITLCPSLQTLHLHRFDDPDILEKYWELNPSIQTLCLSTTLIPLSVFSRVPKLERLVLSHTWFSDNNSSSLVQFPLIGLKELEIEMDGDEFNENIPQLLAFVRQPSSARNIKAFRNLNTLMLYLDYPERDQSAINSLFEDMESLQTLTIKSQYRIMHTSLNSLPNLLVLAVMSGRRNGPSWSFLKDINLSQHIKSSFKSLRHLKLQFSCPGRGTVVYVHPGNDLSDCFLSIPSNNYLEQIWLELPIDVGLETENLDQNPLPCLVKIIAAASSRSNFPYLQRFVLDIVFRFTIPGVDNLHLSYPLEPIAHWTVVPCLDVMRNIIEYIAQQSGVALKPCFVPLSPIRGYVQYGCCLTFSFIE
ncbi:hypothetical protein CVT24_003080 [Panaeolus cyanescens]|uniref:F-box domain-containing protein n=1 Tax=Panaeolus cyanescens TaxID=181874 RepID=A0A409VU86_9AGAR|nr:hypothetical protein CVT24_003080 [Panaeolus cyanescens]